jgi:hypothetical protein
MGKKNKKEVHNAHVLISKKIYDAAKKRASAMGMSMTQAIEYGLIKFTEISKEK